MAPMKERPRYTKTADGVNIAYVASEPRSVDLIQVSSFASNLELYAEWPASVRWHDRLASFARVINFDKRGNGLSDRPAGAPTLEERMDDVRAVMDALGSKRAVMIGFSEGGCMSALFAATYPERVSHLILIGCFARAADRSPDDVWQSRVDQIM